MSDIDYAAIAAKIRKRHQPPSDIQRPGDYTRSFTAHILADALDEMAREADMPFPPPATIDKGAFYRTK